MTLTWTTKDGRQVEVEITLVTSAVVDANMGITKRIHKVDVVARVAGSVVGHGEPRTVRNAGSIVACIGDLGLTAERRAEVDAAIHAVDASDVEWHEMVARREAAEREYEARCAVMRKAMSY